MDEGLISIVVPVYNTEKYLDRCIESIVNQTYRNLEILLIDDGSADSCPQKCDAWAEKDNRIRVIHKVNEGQGYARNTGLDHAAGEYVCFFDSDDFIALDTIEKAYERGLSEKADLVVFGFSEISVDGKVLSSLVPGVGAVTYKGAQVQNWFLPEMIAPDPKGDGRQLFQMSACMMLISTQLVRRSGWRFVSEREIMSEDVYSLLVLSKDVDSVAVLPEALYYYRTNAASTSRRYQPDRYGAIVHFYQESIRLCERLNYSEEIKHRISSPYLAFTIAAMKQEVAYHDRKTATARLRLIIDDELLQKVLWEKRKDKTNLKKRILFWAIRWKQYSVCYALLAAKNAAAKK